MPMTATHPKQINIDKISSGIMGSPRKKKAEIEIRKGEVVSTTLVSANGANTDAMLRVANRVYPKMSLAKNIPLVSHGKSL